jgi:peptide/nickel transport system ATP-binding protein
VSGPVLEVRGLRVEYATPNGPAQAVENVSFDLAQGEFLAIVGESGCGKSTMLFAIAQLLSYPARLVG